MNKIELKALDKQLSDKIKEIYLQELNHQVGSILCRLFKQALIILIEESVTLPERKLNNQEYQQLAHQMRTVFDQIVQPQIKTIIEQTTDMQAIDFLCDTTLDTGRTGIIVILELKPKTLAMGYY
ncbi:MAG: DUF2294 domain-containing protein [Microcoleaceae cyanobacterium]